MLESWSVTPADRAALLHERRSSVAVVVPTRDEAATIGPITRSLVGLRELGAIDRVVVVDESSDDTGVLAASAGADVVAQSALMSEFGAVLGKGDALWRALSVVEEDVICFVDGDTVDFDAEMVCGLVAAVVGGRDFAKATYRRPFASGGAVAPTGGGRVTELTAKPLLRALLPELGGFTQPLAGELAARTELLRTLPFATGYAVDAALLIDVWRQVGLAGMAQIDVGVRQNRHRPLEQLASMADEVAGAILQRAGVLPQLPVTERPPLAQCAPATPLA